ncbi:MAG: hypothetical protein L0H96_16960 [Humibacillus sp.]|nr:hypothetical protein [Humibacillus sp.]MDN5778587.1 hypothetical protein [Humibacillus sp.]
MRPALVPGRWPGAVLAALGVLLALPSVVWPVLGTTTFAEYDVTYSGPSSTQVIWSWGKFALAGLGEPPTSPMYEVTNTLGLLSVIVSLVIGAGAVAVWAFVRYEPGRSLGIAGTAFLAAAQVVFIAQWMGRRQSGSVGEDASTLVEQQPAGWLQVASAVVLLVAAGVMLRRPARGWPVPTRRRPAGTESHVAPVLVRSGDAPGAPPVVGGARRREFGEAGGRACSVDGPVVGFSDDASRPDERPDPRFEPPA